MAKMNKTAAQTSGLLCVVLYELEDNPRWKIQILKVVKCKLNVILDVYSGWRQTLHTRLTVCSKTVQGYQAYKLNLCLNCAVDSR